jgi:opacity protein-like surface antigen
MSRKTLRLVPITLILTLTLAVAAATAAPPRHHHRGLPASPEFFLSFSAGRLEPAGQSDLWGENQELYGLEPSELGDWVVGVELGRALNPYLEVVLGAGYYTGENASYRYTDTEGYPIALAQHLRLAPLSAGVKWLPFGRVGPTGRHRRLVPYLGGGVEAVFWSYEEMGDFIDPFTDEVYSGRAAADGTAFGFYLNLGLEVPVSPFWSLYLEGRHQSAEDDLGSLFAGYESFDLTGSSIVAGASFRF